MKTLFEKIIAIELTLFILAIIGIIIIALGYEIGRYLVFATISTGAVIGIIFGFLVSTGLLKKDE